MHFTHFFHFTVRHVFKFTLFFNISKHSLTNQTDSRPVFEIARQEKSPLVISPEIQKIKGRIIADAPMFLKQAGKNAPLKLKYVYFFLCKSQVWIFKPGFQFYWLFFLYICFFFSIFVMALGNFSYFWKLKIMELKLKNPDMTRKIGNFSMKNEKLLKNNIFINFHNTLKFAWL